MTSESKAYLPAPDQKTSRNNKELERSLETMPMPTPVVKQKTMPKMDQNSMMSQKNLLLDVNL